MRHPQWARPVKLVTQEIRSVPAIRRATTTSLSRKDSKRFALQSLLDAPDGLTRPELARAMGLTVPAISPLVRDLEGVIDLSAEAPRPAKTGPVPLVLRIRADLGYVIGIDISHPRIQVAVADLLGRRILDAVMPWDVENDLHGALAYAAQLVRSLADERAVASDQIAGIGLAVAAPVGSFDDAYGTRARVRHLGGDPSEWGGIDLHAVLINFLAALPDGHMWSRIALYIDNSSNLGALAELKLGAARGKQSALYVHLHEHGIGGGLLLDGQIYRGVGGVAGEFGHMVLEPERPERCSRCGRPCVEAVILSMLGLSGQAGELAPWAQLVESALAGNEGARDTITDIAGYCGGGLAGIITVLNPDVVLVGGPFPPQAYGLVIPPMRAAADRLIIAPVARDLVFALGALGSRAPVDGAVWLALERTRVDYLLAVAEHDALFPGRSGLSRSAATQ
jgi:predicted NBD/HSP70 family sugar kinase